MLVLLDLGVGEGKGQCIKLWEPLHLGISFEDGARFVIFNIVYLTPGMESDTGAAATENENGDLYKISFNICWVNY